MIKRRILIVEDELLLAMDLEAVLQDNGFDVWEPVPNVDRALAFLSNDRPDLVTLDMNLGGKTLTPIAERLVAENIPFVLISGYDPQTTKDAVFEGVPLVRKPFDERHLVDTINSMLGAAEQ